MRPDELAGCVPIRLYARGGRHYVDWCRLGDTRFTEPFFDQTVERAFRRPSALLFRPQTPIEALGEWHALSPGLPPGGFIFHMSRCGSTLVSRMLAALPQAVVISEAGPVDRVLRAHLRDPRATDEERVNWLRWVLSALGQRRRGDEEHFFVKFDAWNAPQLPLVRRAFPEVPAVFLYREPLEVMVSQLRRAPSWMLSGALEPGLLGVGPGAAARMPREEYCARALARICEAALRHREDLRLVNYSELPGAAWAWLLDFFRAAHTPADVGRMRHAARFDAKTPSLSFEPDAAAKNREATDTIRELNERHLRPLYEQLEAARRAQSGGGAQAAVAQTFGEAGLSYVRIRFACS